MVSDECFKTMYLPAYDNVVGRYPENFNEIMLSVRILNNLGIEEPKIGMELPVHIVLYDWLRNGTENIDMTFQLSGYYTDYVEDIEKLPKAFFLEELLEQQNLLIINEGAAITIRSRVGNCIFALFGIVLIILSMNLFIYNIFSISVSKEKQEYGLLKVIGAEPKQIREIFLFSALKILLSGCILGILFGSLAVKLILPPLLEKNVSCGKWKYKL